jgi:hypothetical protein
MSADQENPGRASGFEVEEDREGGFRWSAFGPLGARRGHFALSPSDELTSRYARG